MTRRLVLFDGSALIFRAYFSHPTTFQTAAGLPTNATYGFASMFRKLLDGRRPTHGAVVFDPRGETTRDALHADYKAQRPAMPDPLALQLPWIDRVVEAHGFPVLRVDGWEADDVIGTLARRAEAAGFEVIVVSGDKDFAQLVTEQVRMFVPFQDILYDRALVKKKWGVFPEQIPDLFALVGDAVDNIPGVDGIGQKTAVELLERHGTLDAVYAALAGEKPRTQKLLEAGRASAELSRTLATIRLDAPTPLPPAPASGDDDGLEALRLPAPAPDALEALYQALEFHSLLGPTRRAARAAEPTPEDDAALTVLATEAARAAWLEAHAAAPRFALAPRLVGKKPVVAALTRVGVAVPAPETAPEAAGPEAAPEVVVFAFDDVPAERAPSFVALLADAARPKVLHGAKPLLVFADAHGLAVAGVVFDTRIASFLVDPVRGIPHLLPEVARLVLHRAPPPVDATRPRADAIDAELVLALEAALAPELDAMGLRAQLVERDLPLSFVLARMVRVGVGVDAAALGGLEARFLARLAELEAEVHGLAGKPFNLGSPKQLAEVLFETLKLPVVKRTKTGYSTDAEVLEKLAAKHPIAERLLEHRKLEKLVSTYTRVLRESVLPETGRIHACFEETTSTTGRLISTDPDLQRTPVRTPEGKLIREAFVAPAGKKLVSCDWSQIELRVLAHLSGDQRMRAAFAAGEDIHTRTAALVQGVEPDAVTPAMRRAAKAVNFGILYGQSAFGLAKALAIPQAEAAAFIAAYFEAFAGAAAFIDDLLDRCRRDGQVTTLLGRRRSTRSIASLMRSAAEPCTTVLMAVRSGSERAKPPLELRRPAWSRTPVMPRRRPRIVVTWPSRRQRSRTSSMNTAAPAKAWK